jgi:hypothetical protein
MPVTFGIFSYSIDSPLLWPGANPFTVCILSASVYFLYVCFGSPLFDQTFESLWPVPWSIDSAENAPTSWAENNPELAAMIAVPLWPN